MVEEADLDDLFGPPALTTPVPLLDDHDRAGVLALLIRSIRIDDQLDADRSAAQELNARIAANTLARSKTITAFSVFGFDTGDELWDSVWEALGESDYAKAIALARGQALPLLEQISDAGGEIGSDGKNSRPSGKLNERAGQGAPPKIKDAILDYVRAVGSAGTTAKEVRQHLVDAYRISVHEKTPGMTLYRLLKDGLVTREGRNWFATMQGGKENEAPTAKPSNASETGGGATPSNHQPGLTDD